MARAPRPEYLILDIETVPDLARWTRPETPEGVEPRFPPTWAHRIVAIGTLWLDHAYRLRTIDVIDSPDTGRADDRERSLLAALSDRVGRARPVLVTYNGRSFDLPVIALRALCHAVPLPWYYRDREIRHRYSELGHLDLCDWLADHRVVRAGKLDAIAQLMGLPGKAGSGIDGSQVEGLYATGKLAAIETYCLADVAQTALLLLRFRLLQGRLAAADYRARVGELLDALAVDGRVRDVLEGLDRERLLGPP